MFQVTQVSAQLQSAKYKHDPDKKFAATQIPGNSNHAQTTQCGQDTVLYASAKATSLRELNINTATSADKVCQWFDAPQLMMLHGFTFYA